MQQDSGLVFKVVDDHVFANLESELGVLGFKDLSVELKVVGGLVLVVLRWVLVGHDLAEVGDCAGSKGVLLVESVPIEYGGCNLGLLVGLHFDESLTSGHALFIKPKDDVFLGDDEVSLGK